MVMYLKLKKGKIKNVLQCWTPNNNWKLSGSKIPKLLQYANIVPSKTDNH